MYSVLGLTNGLHQEVIPMDVTVVASTTLSTIAYDGTRNLLQLEFAAGLSINISVFP